MIGDVLKTEVYALARHFNSSKEMIPPAIINKRPSADLLRISLTINRCRLMTCSIRSCACILRTRRLLRRLLRGNECRLVYDILNRVESPANEFKRRQLPPTLIISRNAIGIGRRRPVTHHYKRRPAEKVQSAD